MEDLLIAACKKPLKVGLLSSAHRGRQTETERRRRSAGGLNNAVDQKNRLLFSDCVTVTF